MSIFATKKLHEIIEFIDRNKTNYDIKTMCSVPGVARSTHYKSLDKEILKMRN